MVRTSYPPVLKVWTRSFGTMSIFVSLMALSSSFLIAMQIARRGKVLRPRVNDVTGMRFLAQSQIRDIELLQRCLDWQPGDKFYGWRLNPTFHYNRDL